MRKQPIIQCLTLLFITFNSVYLSNCQQQTNVENKNCKLKNGEYTAQINGLRLWYKISGSGPVCILPTPGWGPSSELYFLKFQPLESNFTMVYLDTRGSGRSERPELNSYTMQNFVADLEGLRNHLGTGSVWLMGHSEGGRMILNYAYEYSDHVKGIILVDTPLNDTSEGNARSQRMQLRQNEPWFNDAFKAFQERPKTQTEFETHIRTALPFFFFSYNNIDKNRDLFEKMSLSFHATQGMGQSNYSSLDLESFVSNMKIPALIIVGDNDFLYTPSSAKYLHSIIPQSQLLIIKNAGHFPWLEEPQQFFDGIQKLLPILNSNGCSLKD